nr:ParB N-terminal domain-containing protein [uncultured Oscillibacter sp.]
MERKNALPPTMVSLRDIYVLPENDIYVNSPDSLKPLLESVRENGILVPIRLAKLEEGGYYLVDGHRRCIAAAIAKIQNVPAFVEELPSRELETLTVSNNQSNRTSTHPKVTRIALYAKAIVSTWPNHPKHTKRKPPKGKGR